MGIRYGGRPRVYTDEMIREIVLYVCEQIAEGRTLSRTLEEDRQKFDPPLPSHGTIWNWIDDSPEYTKLYSRARRHHAQTLDDKIQAIADNSNQATYQPDRVKFAALAWRAERANRTAFMLQSRVELSGPEGKPLQSISKTMDVKEAADAYEDLLRSAGAVVPAPKPAEPSDEDDE